MHAQRQPQIHPPRSRHGHKSWPWRDGRSPRRGPSPPSAFKQSQFCPEGAGGGRACALGPDLRAGCHTSSASGCEWDSV